VVEENGYREFDHTADWGIEVWAQDIFDLLGTAARGMFSLLEVQKGEGNRSAFTFSLDKDQDNEDLLVEFLNELLFLSEQNQVAFDDFEFDSTEKLHHFTAHSYPIIGQKKEIKAVTYYGLSVDRRGNRLETKIVFDV